MHQTLMKFCRGIAVTFAVAAGLALSAPAAWSQEAAGRFIVVVGEVKVVDPSGSVRLAATGANLMAGDTVVTAPRALAQLRLADGSLISVRADTRFTLEEFSFTSQADRLGRMFINLVQGSLRSITGLIGRTNRAGFRLDTPHATIGVRGTDFETAVLVRPQHGFVPGTLSAVFDGGIFTRTDAGIIDTAVGKAVFVASRSAIPRPLPSIPEFMLQGGAPRAEALPDAAAQQATGSAALPAVQKGAAELEGDAKVESTAPLLINPLLTPISPTTTTKSLTTESTKSLTTTISPTTTDAIKSLGTTSPTTTEATKSLSTTTSPLPTSPTLTPIAPSVTSPSTTVSPTITAPMTTTPSKLSPATTTDPKLTTPLKR
ncbi:MAG: FecR domain-containing protein [Gammaproteobacteria bacterium]|nr:FecR domain-containing protein [Gammaproteobacteria bacterium]